MRAVRSRSSRPRRWFRPGPSTRLKPCRSPSASRDSASTCITYSSIVGWADGRAQLVSNLTGRDHRAPRGFVGDCDGAAAQRSISSSSCATAGRKPGSPRSRGSATAGRRARSSRPSIPATNGRASSTRRRSYWSRANCRWRHRNEAAGAARADARRDAGRRAGARSWHSVRGPAGPAQCASPTCPESRSGR